MTTDGVGLEVYGRTDVGRVRANNEDAFVIADLMAPTWTHAMREPVELSVGARGVLLAVSDGMGGAQAGEVASALTLHALRRGMVTVEASGAEAALTASVERANQKVWDAGTASGQKGMGDAYGGAAPRQAGIRRGGRCLAPTFCAAPASSGLRYHQSCAQLMLDAGALTREEAETFQYKNRVVRGHRGEAARDRGAESVHAPPGRQGPLVLGMDHGQGHGRRDPRASSCLRLRWTRRARGSSSS